MSISAITPLINVVDCDRSIAFYKTVLADVEVINSWTNDHGKTGWARLEAPGGFSMMVNSPDGPVEERSADRLTRGAYQDVLHYVYVDDVFALRERLVEAGLTPSEISAEFYGLHEMTIQDPDGYWLGLGTPIADPT